MIFVYGFGPYKEFQDNISANVISLLPLLAGVHSHVFDTAFDRGMFEAAFELAQPNYILGLGQSRRETHLQLESIAKNLMRDTGIDPAAISSSVAESERMLRWTLPLESDCAGSKDAGSYVCNYSMWIAEEWAREHDAKSAFIHIPVAFDVQRVVDYVTSILKRVKAE